MQGSLGSRNSTINGVPSSGVQQQSGTLSSGRFASNNMPGALSQVRYSTCMDWFFRILILQKGWIDLFDLCDAIWEIAK